MHNGMVETDEEKMSKSVGNIFQLSEALNRYGRDAVVAYLVSGHYRQPLEFSGQALEEAQARVERIHNFTREAAAGEEAAAGGDDDDGYAGERVAEFLAALADDFNTPRALAALSDLVAEGNRRAVPGAREALERMLPLLGLESLLESEAAADAEAEALLAERERARSEREFERADKIRDELAERGWEVRDSAEGARLIRRDRGE
jgi:cysteinyl-tRNA synthetase